MKKMIKKEAKKTMGRLNQVISGLKGINPDNKGILDESILCFLIQRIPNKIYPKQQISELIFKNFHALKQQSKRNKAKNYHADIMDYINFIADKKQNSVLSEESINIIKEFLTSKEFQFFDSWLDSGLNGLIDYKKSDSKIQNKYRQRLCRILKKLSNNKALYQAITTDKDLNSFCDSYAYTPFKTAKKEEKRKAYNTKIYASEKAFRRIELNKKGLLKGIEKMESELKKACDIKAYDGKNMQGDIEIESKLSKLNWRLNRLEKRKFSVCTQKEMESLIPVKQAHEKHNFSIASRSAHPAIYPDRKMDYKPCLAFPVINPYQGHSGIESTYNPLRYVPGDSVSIKDIINQDIKSCQINIVSDAMGHYQVRPVQSYGFWLSK